MAVPPHIWGDAVALELSHEACDAACYRALRELASNASELEVLLDGRGVAKDTSAGSGKHAWG